MRAISAAKIAKMDTDDLRDVAGDDFLYTDETRELAQQELDRRDYDDSDPLVQAIRSGVR